VRQFYGSFYPRNRTDAMGKTLRGSFPKEPRADRKPNAWRGAAL
jgi:hypothetical protein